MSPSVSFSFTEDDSAFMGRALSLAHKGRFTVPPNPRVGCVIVRPSTGKGSVCVLGEGFHHRKGEPHAERMALAVCKEDPRGATLYVTLEPCCHHGATPPCTDAILEAGIHRVVAAIRDPFPKVQGQGFEILRAHGIQVDVGLMEEDAWFENRFFFHYHTQKLPWVILKAAVSLDGKMSTASGHSQWITGETARLHVHEMRAEVDAVLAGIGTVKADNPSLTVRLPEKYSGIRQPVRVILDPQLRIPRDSQLIRTLDQAPLWIFCHDSASESAIQELRFFKASVTPVGGTRHSLDLAEVLRTLAASGIQSVLVEGGPRVHTAFLEQHLTDELLIYVAPKLIGGSASPTFYMGRGVDTMEEAGILQRVERLSLGADTLIRGIFRRFTP